MRARGFLLISAVAITAGVLCRPYVPISLATAPALIRVAAPAPFLTLPAPAPPQQLAREVDPPHPDALADVPGTALPAPIASSKGSDASSPTAPSPTAPSPTAPVDPFAPLAAPGDPLAVPNAPNDPLAPPDLITGEDPSALADPAAELPELPSLAPELPELPEPSTPQPAAPSSEELASIAKETWIYAEPRWSSRRLGYLRAGAVVPRRAKPSGFNACAEGWYRIQPAGYVCVGQAATLNIHASIVEASSRRPDPKTLPYTYVMSRLPPPPRYARLPSEEEQLRAETDLKAHLAKTARAALEPAFVEPPPADPTPPVLLYGLPAPGLAGTWRSPDAISLGSARPRSGFALLSTFDHEGRRFGMTTELEIIPIDRTRVVRPSSFAGIALDDDVTLPVAFVRSRHAFRYLPGPGGGLVQGEKLRFREAIPLATLGRDATTRRTTGGADYIEARDGSWVRADQIVRVDRISSTPAWAAAGRKWIDVSILRQSLVAYEGKKPVYVTLVSTGADGLGDPKKTHSTIQGTFLIHTKHTTVTMDGENGDEFDFRDVPFVQFFTEGFALHGAYWHDDFGTPRSHGCVNLAPIDAAWLFGWTTPEVPAGWHAALSLRKGTLVYTHP